jgi:hypothetical protein
MSKWLLVVALGLQAHFAASCLVPLRNVDKGAMGGTMQWFWPWGNGDHGPLGTMVADGASPAAGILLGIASCTLFILAALAVAGWWVPTAWWRPLAVAAAGSSFVLMALFFGPTKVIPMVMALGTIYISIVRPEAFAVR